MLLSLFAWIGSFEIFQLKLTNLLQGKAPVSSEIVIVAVDETTSAVENGLGDPRAWSYLNYGQVYSYISQFQPKVIGIDFFFQFPRDDIGDAAFGATLKEGPPTVLIYPMNASLYEEKNGYYIQTLDDIRNNLPIKEVLDAPNVTLATALVFSDTDQVRRQMPSLIYDESHGRFYENFAFAIAREALQLMQVPLEPDITPNEYNMSPNGPNIPLENGKMYINYATHPFHSSLPESISYQRVSFLDVYNQQIENPQALFKDKIVLIGPSALLFADSYTVPTSSEFKMDGVEIQANAIQTILEERFLVPMNLAQSIALIFVLALVSAIVFMYLPILWALVYLFGVGLVYALLTPFFFSRGLIVDMIHPYLALLATFVVVFLYRYFTEFKEKMVLKSAFSKYVNPTVAQQIVENAGKLHLGGEARNMTVLFTDIRGFTSISEKLKPESLVTLLNEYLSAMSNVIMAEGGTVDKFEGDAIMAFFGAPLDQTDHAIRACNSALKMSQALGELYQIWRSAPPLPGGEQRPLIDFRCGIHTGDAIVGNVGSSNRLEYTAIGDTINLGSRLEGANKKYGTRIMVSEDTYNSVKDHFEMRELDVIRVVGKEKPIQTFELLHFKNRLDENTAQLLRHYHEGIALYKQRNFANALQKFEEILKQFPDDGPSKLYFQRCQVLKDFPPGEDWDGVFEMSSK
ncbi:MAG: CHASE2 domain-containing protein [Candidatus Gracilibacteria bacterium]